MKIVVSGEADELDLRDALSTMHAVSPFTQLIEFGGAGVDLVARFWAEENGIKVLTIRESTPTKAAVAALKVKPDAVIVLAGASPALVDLARRKGVQLCPVVVRGHGEELEDNGVEYPGDDA